MGGQWSKQASKAAKYRAESGDELAQAVSADVLQAAQSCPTGKGRWCQLFKPQANTTVCSAQHPSGTTSASCTTAALKESRACPETPPAPALPAKQKLDPKDFMFANLSSTQMWKLPGNVNGQQFIIDNCQDCDLYIMDACAMVTIDDCHNCRILVGPTESSIFIRNCNNCKFACITRQLRTRECQDCSLLLMCRTRPIIESSTGMAFGCYDAPYKGLAAQLASVRLNPLHNFWCDVFDFTPVTSTAAAGTGGKAAAGTGDEAAPAACAAKTVQERNWSLLPPDISAEQLLSPVPDAVQQLLRPRRGPAHTDPVATPALTEDGAGRELLHCSIARSKNSSSQDCDELVVLHTCGSAQQQLEGLLYLFMLLPGVQHDAVLQWLQAHCARTAQERKILTTATPASTGCTGRCILVHSNEAIVPAAVLKQMASAAGWSMTELKHMQSSSAPTTCKKADLVLGNKVCCIGIELLCCDDAHVLELSSSASDLGAICTSSKQVADLFRSLGTDG